MWFWRLCREYLRCRKMYSGQLPLYRFLEGQAVEDLQRQDQETYEKLVESNTRYLGKMVREENRDARVTPEITEKPQVMDFAKNEERSEVTETPEIQRRIMFGRSGQKLLRKRRLQQRQRRSSRCRKSIWHRKHWQIMII